MIGKTLALTIRSVREDTRLLRTHLFRMFLLLIIFWILLVIYWEGAGVGAPGLEFFQAVTYLNFAFITLAGFGFFASAITEEKEEMTLGLLRMAGIGPLTLLLGKSAPRLLGALLLLSLQFPFTLLAITLGGVTIEQVTAAYCTLLSYMLLLACLALCCSVMARRTSGAAFATAAVIGLFLFVPWWYSKVVLAVYGGTFFGVLDSCFVRLYEASPLHRLGDIMTTGFAGDPFGFQAVTNTAAAALFFLLSWAIFDWFNHDEQASSPARGMISRSSKLMRRWGGGRVWFNALFWKDFHFIAGGPFALLLKFVLYGLLIGGIAFSMPWLSWNGRFDWQEFGEWQMDAMLIAFLIEGAVLAASVFQQEVQWKTLSGLMLLPISLAELAYFKVAGCLIGLLPSMAWFCVGALCAPDSLGRALEDLLGEPQFWWLATQYVILVHLSAFLSLFVKWAAMPLALGIVVFTNGCCLSTMSFSNDDGPFVIMCFLGAFATLVLHFAIAERLRTLAAR